MAQADSGSLGFDASENISVDKFGNFREDGYSFFIARLYDRASGAVDERGISNIHNAKTAGFTDISGYIFPCLRELTKAAAEDQVIQVDNRLQREGISLQMVWIDIETNDHGADWSKNKETNRNFAKAIVEKAQSLGMNVGIYVNKSAWDKIIGSEYNGFGHLPLWWPRWDRRQDFSSFQPFAGWQQAIVHQFSGDVMVGDVEIDQNYKQ